MRTHLGEHRALSFDGHVHTARSHDADHPAAGVLELARRVDLDAIVLTDHGSSLAAQDLDRAGYAGPVTALVGEEVGGSFGHAVIWNVPDRRGVFEAASESIEALGAVVRSQGGLVVLAHPGWWIDGNFYDPMRWMEYDALRRGGIGQAIDAIEIWNQVYYQPSRRLLDAWVALLDRGLFVPIVGNTDFHRHPEHELGLPRNVFFCPAAESDVAACLLSSVQAGRLYITDGPAVTLTVAQHTLGESVPTVPGAPLVVSLAALAPEGGTLELYVGHDIVQRFPLPLGERWERTLTVEAPASDSFVRAEIARATPVPHRTPFSLLTNPVLLDAPPWATSRRGPDEGPVRGPLGFSRRDIERAREREARRQAAQQLRRAR